MTEYSHPNFRLPNLPILDIYLLPYHMGLDLYQDVLLLLPSRRVWAKLIFPWSRIHQSYCAGP